MPSGFKVQDTMTNTFINGFATTPETPQDMLHSDSLTDIKREKDDKE